MSRRESYRKYAIAAFKGGWRTRFRKPDREEDESKKDYAARCQEQREQTTLKRHVESADQFARMMMEREDKFMSESTS